MPTSGPLVRRTAHRIRVAVAAVAVLVIATLGLRAWQLWSSEQSERASLLRQTEHRAAQLAASAASRVAAIVRSVDFLLLEIRSVYGVDNPAFHAMVKRIFVSFPEAPELLLQVSVASPEGELVYSALELKGKVSVADRDAFKVHLDGADRLHISDLVLGRISGMETIPFTRPVLRDGRFAGVVAVSLVPRQIGAILGSFDTASDAELALIGRHDAVLALTDDTRYPALLGRKLPGIEPLVAGVDAARGTLRTGVFGDAAEHVVARQGVAGTDLAVVAALDWNATQEPLTQIFRRAWNNAFTLGAALLLLGASVIALLLRMSRQQQAVAANEARFRSLTNLSSDWYWEQDARFRFTHLAGMLRERTGIAGKAHLGKTRWEMPAPNLSDADWAQHRADLEAHRPFRDFEMLRIGTDGDEHWVSVSGEPVFDESGAFTGYRGVGREITDRKRTEQALRDANERLRVGQATARMIVLDWHIAEDRLEWSDSPQWLRGPLPARTGRYPFWKDQVHPEDRERFLAARARSIATLQGEVLEYRFVRTDGEVHWLRSHQKVFAGPDGKATRMVVALFDITAQKVVEEHLRMSEARLAEAQRIAQIGNWELDVATNVLSWSDQVYRIFEIDRARLATSYEAFLDLVHPEDRAAVDRAYTRSLATREPYRIVHRLRMADGRIKYVEERCETEFAPDGAALRSRGTVQDVTELHLADRALRESAAHLRKLSRRLREVEERERRTMARELHDRIGQNLSTLNLGLGMLGRQIAAGQVDDVDEQLAEMQETLRAIIGHTRDLMSELRPPALEEYGLLAALHDLAADFGRKTRIAAHVEGSPPEPRPPGTVEIAMYRIAQEALNNAAKHAGAAQVRLSLAASDDAIELAISDDGVGFDASQPANGDPTWGLATMRERAEEAGIDLAIDSAPGRGTRVTLRAARQA